MAKKSILLGEDVRKAWSDQGYSPPKLDDLKKEAAAAAEMSLEEIEQATGEKTAKNAPAKPAQSTKTETPVVSDKDVK